MRTGTGRQWAWVVLAALWAIVLTLEVGPGRAQAAASCGSSSGFSICLTVPDGALSGDVPVSVIVSGSSLDLAELHFSWGNATTTNASLYNDYQAPWTFTWPTDRYVDASQYLNVRVRRKGSTTFGTPIWIQTTIENGNDSSVPVNPSDWSQLFSPRAWVGDPVIAAAGDGANGSAAADAVISSVSGSNASVFLYLGDIYEDGTPTELENNYGQAAFDPAGTPSRWGTMASWTRATMGNHEAKTISAFRDYWHQAPDYDSFVHGGVRFLNLNSECLRIVGGCGVGSPQYQFVQRTLAESTESCIVTFWHRPVLSLSEDDQAMRPIWKLLADGGGDVVLNGHAHSMEQYRPMNGLLEINMPDSHMVELISGAGGHYAATGTDADSRAAWIRSGVPGAVYLTAVDGGAGQATALRWAFRDVFGSVVSNGSGSPGSGTVGCGTDQQPPSAPGIPTGTSAVPGTIDLTWTAASDDLASSLTYRIYRDGGSVPVATVTGASTGTVAWRDTGLEGGSQHVYDVEASDGFTTGARSGASAPITVQSGVIQIMSERFDNGLTGWSGVANVSIDTTRGGAGPPSARVSVSGVRGSAWRVFGGGYPNVCVSAALDLQSLSSNVVTLLKLRSASDAPLGGLQVMRSRVLQVTADAAGTIFTSAATLQAGWHTVKLCGAIGSPGTWSMSLDGAPAGSWTTNNGSTPFAKLQVGDRGAKIVTLNVDDVIITQG